MLLFKFKCILDVHLRCACHLLTTISRHVTIPYKKTKLSDPIKKDCTSVQSALEKLQQVVVKLRGSVEIRLALGTALHGPATTRWVSKLEMVDQFVLSKDKILQVVQERKPNLFAEVEKLYLDYEPIYKDYQKVIEPIKKIIIALEVCLCFIFLNDL